MKKCPSCNDYALYDDEITTCPLCGATLVTYRRTVVHRATGSVVKPVSSNATVNRSGTGDSQSSSVSAEPSFETREGFRYIYRGTVTEVNSHARYHNRLKKIINAIFRGEPYQFGNTSHETVFRLEEFHRGRLSGKKRDLIFYGDIEGRLNYGDDVRVVVKKRGDRYVATKIYSNETESQIRPTPQIPAIFFSLLLLLVVFLSYYLVSSGIVVALLAKVVTYAILIIAFLIFIKNFFGD